jgi:hypothetical protein
MNAIETNEFAPLIGATVVEIIGGEVTSEDMRFKLSDGRVAHFWYEHDCCASCNIEDIIGDLDDLIGSPLVEAEEISSANEPAPEDADSYTWTFYRFSTVKGTVTIRWLGESNGYYFGLLEPSKETSLS